MTSKGKFEIRWDTQNYYNIQYIENEYVRFRFDNHPNPHSPCKQCHPSPDIDKNESEEFYIEVDKPTLVIRVIIKIWRKWIQTEDYSILNNLDNPP